MKSLLFYTSKMSCYGHKVAIKGCYVDTRKWQTGSQTSKIVRQLRADPKVILSRDYLSHIPDISHVSHVEEVVTSKIGTQSHRRQSLHLPNKERSKIRDRRRTCDASTFKCRQNVEKNMEKLFQTGGNHSSWKPKNGGITKKYKSATQAKRHSKTPEETRELLRRIFGEPLDDIPLHNLKIDNNSKSSVIKHNNANNSRATSNKFNMSLNKSLPASISIPSTESLPVKRKSDCKSGSEAVKVQRVRPSLNIKFPISSSYCELAHYFECERFETELTETYSASASIVHCSQHSPTLNARPVVRNDSHTRKNRELKKYIKDETVDLTDDNTQERTTPGEAVIELKTEDLVVKEEMLEKWSETESIQKLETSPGKDRIITLAELCRGSEVKKKETETENKVNVPVQSVDKDNSQITQTPDLEPKTPQQELPKNNLTKNPAQTGPSTAKIKQLVQGEPKTQLPQNNSSLQGVTISTQITQVKPVPKISQQVTQMQRGPNTSQQKGAIIPKITKILIVAKTGEQKQQQSNASLQGATITPQNRQVQTGFQTDAKMSQVQGTPKTPQQEVTISQIRRIQSVSQTDAKISKQVTQVQEGSKTPRPRFTITSQIRQNQIAPQTPQQANLSLQATKNPSRQSGLTDSTINKVATQQLTSQGARRLSLQAEPKTGQVPQTLQQQLTSHPAPQVVIQAHTVIPPVGQDKNPLQILRETTNLQDCSKTPQRTEFASENLRQLLSERLVVRPQPPPYPHQQVQSQQNIQMQPQQNIQPPAPPQLTLLHQRVLSNQLRNQRVPRQVMTNNSFADLLFQHLALYEIWRSESLRFRKQMEIRFSPEDFRDELDIYKMYEDAQYRRYGAKLIMKIMNMDVQAFSLLDVLSRVVEKFSHRFPTINRYILSWTYLDFLNSMLKPFAVDASLPQFTQYFIKAVAVNCNMMHAKFYDVRVEPMRLQQQDDARVQQLNQQKVIEEQERQKREHEKRLQIQKQQKEEELRLQREQQQKEREEEELRLQKEKEQEALRLQKEKEQEALRLQKEKEQEALRLQKEKEQEALRLQKETEQEALRLQKEKEQEALRLQQKNKSEGKSRKRHHRSERSHNSKRKVIANGLTADQMKQFLQQMAEFSKISRWIKAYYMMPQIIRDFESNKNNYTPPIPSNNNQNASTVSVASACVSSNNVPNCTAASNTPVPSSSFASGDQASAAAPSDTFTDRFGKAVVVNSSTQPVFTPIVGGQSSKQDERQRAIVCNIRRVTSEEWEVVPDRTQELQPQREEGRAVSPDVEEIREEIEIIDLTWIDDNDNENVFQEIIENQMVKNEDGEAVVQDRESVSPADSGLGSPRGQMMDDHQYRCFCGNCAIFVCRCRSHMYCSKECQVQDWEFHQHMCGKILAA